MTRAMIRSTLVVVLSATILLGCGQEMSGPPKLRPGMDECAECGMIIDDARFAAAVLVQRAGRREYLLFDDIGCMVRSERARQNAPTDRFFCDFSTGEWITSTQPSFLAAEPELLRTPMASGVVAFRDPGAARTASEKYGGTVAGWAEILARDPAPRTVPGAPPPTNAPHSADAAPAAMPSPSASEFADSYYLDTCAQCSGRLGARGETVEGLYAEREVRFCHDDCRRRFEADLPAAFSRLDDRMIADQLPYYPIPASIVSDRPLPAAPVDFIWGNRLFRVTDEDERRRLLADPVQFIRALDRAVITAQAPHYGMPSKCPVQGDILPGDRVIDIVIANRMVRLCCPRCVRVVKARPSQYLGMVEYANRAARNRSAEED